MIRVEARQRIYIRIVHLHLAPTIAECERASLTIIDGYKHEHYGTDRKESASETSEAKFCGSQLYYSEEGMKSYLSSANRIVVRLVTQEGPATSMIGEERIGFKIVWTAVEGLIGENGIDDGIVGGNGGAEACKDQFVCHGGQVCVEQVGSNSSLDLAFIESRTVMGSVIYSYHFLYSMRIMSTKKIIFRDMESVHLVLVSVFTVLLFVMEFTIVSKETSPMSNIVSIFMHSSIKKKRNMK